MTRALKSELPGSLASVFSFRLAVSLSFVPASLEGAVRPRTKGLTIVAWISS